MTFCPFPLPVSFPVAVAKIPGSCCAMYELWACGDRMHGSRMGLSQGHECCGGWCEVVGRLEWVDVCWWNGIR